MRKIIAQFSRFAVVGLTMNAVGYGIYLFLTNAGVDSKVAMTIVYGAAVVQTFTLNKNWSFRCEGAATAKTGPAFTRYIIVYGLGYVMNLLGLVILVDWMGVPHQLAQGFMILVVALTMFLMQRYWIFATQLRDNDT